MRDQTARQKPSTPASPNPVNSVPAPQTHQPSGHILELQRMYGNQAVQRLLQRTPDAIQQRTTTRRIHRKTDFGLAQGAHSTSFVDKAHAYINDAANASKSLTDMATKLGDLMADELKAVGVPPIPVVVKAGASTGVFKFGSWVLEADPAAFSTNPATTTVGKLTKAEAAEIVDTIYHESRHGEQWFQMARLKAGEGWNADKINTEIGIPKPIAEKAEKDPLSKPTGAARTAMEALPGGKDKAAALDDQVDQVTDLFNSVYGTNRPYRRLILNADFRSGMDTLAKSAAAVTAANLATTVSTLQPIINAWETDIIPNKIDTEITRITAISTKSANDTKMLTHLQAMKTPMQSAITTWKAGTAEADIKKLLPFANTLRLARYAAYKDMPEEADAWAVAATAKTKYNAK